jgi:hypothetical protein
MKVFDCSAHFAVLVEADSPEHARTIIKAAIEYALQFTYSSTIISYVDPVPPQRNVDLRMPSDD